MFSRCMLLRDAYCIMHIKVKVNILYHFCITEWKCFANVTTIVVALCTLCNHKQMYYSPNVLFTLSEEMLSRVQRYTTSKLSPSQHAFPMMWCSLPNWGTALDKTLKIIITTMHKEQQKKKLLTWLYCSEACVEAVKQ